MAAAQRAEPSASARPRRRPPRRRARRSSGRSTPRSGPAARSSPRGSARTSCAACSGRCSAGARAADPDRREDLARPCVASRRGGLDRGELDGLGRRDQRADRAAARPAVVDRDAGPDRWHHRLVQGVGPGRGSRRPVARGLPPPWASSDVLLPLAVHPERPWLLLDDGGPTLRATRPDGTGDHDIAAWERILPEYAALQRSVEGDATATRCWPRASPTGGRAGCPGSWPGSLEDDVAWSPDHATTSVPLPTPPVGGCAAASPRSTAAVAELEAAGIPASIQHDDLHGGNILVGPDGDRFFDWGDAVIAHPFSTLTTTFNSIAHHTGRARRSGLRAPARRLHGGLDGLALPAPRSGARRRARTRSRLHLQVARLGARPDRARTGRDGRHGDAGRGADELHRASRQEPLRAGRRRFGRAAPRAPSGGAATHHLSSWMRTFGSRSSGMWDYTDSH